MKQQADEEQGSSHNGSVWPKPPQSPVDPKAHTFHHSAEQPYEQLPPVTVMETRA